MPFLVCTAVVKKPVWCAWALAILLLVSAGMIYRVSAHHLKLLGVGSIALPVPLSDFPRKINGWVGSDLFIRSTTKEYMERNFADDFISRRYINSATKAWADVYIVYCATRPGGILGHQPLVCYPANGWIHDITERYKFITLSGRQISCLIHRFHKPAPTHEQIIVLSFYVLNGRITTDEKKFSGIFGRRPNLSGDVGRYVAQVQISSVLENTVRAIVKDIADLVLDYLPDKDGKVQAVEYNNATVNVLK
jgi:hypothetical protein